MIRRRFLEKKSERGIEYRRHGEWAEAIENVSITATNYPTTGQKTTFPSSLDAAITLIRDGLPSTENPGVAAVNIFEGAIGFNGDRPEGVVDNRWVAYKNKQDVYITWKLDMDELEEYGAEIKREYFARNTNSPIENIPSDVDNPENLDRKHRRAFRMMCGLLDAKLCQQKAFENGRPASQAFIKSVKTNYYEIPVSAVEGKHIFYSVGWTQPDQLDIAKTVIRASNPAEKEAMDRILNAAKTYLNEMNALIAKRKDLQSKIARKDFKKVVNLELYAIYDEFYSINGVTTSDSIRYRPGWLSKEKY